MSANHPPADPPESADRLQHLAGTPRQAAYTPTYSSLVRRLRIVLPVAGILVLGIVGLWPRIVAQFNRPSELSQEDRRARMVNTRYVGTDAHGRPYTITADATEQAPGGGPIDMTNAVAELTLENGRWVAVKADHGHYDQAAGWIDLNGHVELFHDDGYRFTTERAHVDFAKNFVAGDRAVEGHGPKGQIEARGFRVQDNGDTITFTGPARLTLRPNAARIPDPDAKTAQTKKAGETGSNPPSDAPPTVITATGDIQWLQQDRVYVAHGNAVAKRGPATLTGDAVTAYYRDPAPRSGGAVGQAGQTAAAGGNIEIWRVIVEGNVRIDSDGRVAVGDRLDYDADKQVILLTGRALKATTPTETITARDSLEYWQDSDQGVARGDAVVTRKDQSLTGDVATAHFAKDAQGRSSLHTVDAIGHVVITAGTDTVHGDKGTYDAETQRAVVTGNVVAMRGENLLQGDSAEVDQQAGINRIFPAPGKRARAYFVSHEDQPAKNDGSSGPLEITADHDLEWLKQDQAYVARGSVVAKRGAVTLTGDTLIGYYRPRLQTAPPQVRSAQSKVEGGAPPRNSVPGQPGQAGLDEGNTEIWRVVATGDVHIASDGRDAYGDRMDYDADKRTVVLTGHALKATARTDVATARDSLEYWQDLELGVARGDATVTQANGKSLAGDAVAGHFAKDAKGQSSLDTMRAADHVTIVTASDIVHGDHGTYDAATQRAVVTGNVKVTRGECQLEGESAEVNQENGISQIFQGSNKRVRGLYIKQKCPPNGSAAPHAAGGQP